MPNEITVSLTQLKPLSEVSRPGQPTGVFHSRGLLLIVASLVAAIGTLGGLFLGGHIDNFYYTYWTPAESMSGTRVQSPLRFLKASSPVTAGGATGPHQPTRPRSKLFAPWRRSRTGSEVARGAAPAPLPVMAVSLLQQMTAVLAPVLTIGVFASPVEILWAIVQARDVKNYALLPYLTMQANCGIYLLYALVIADWSIIVTNGVGLLISSLTMVVYACFSPPERRPSVLLQMAAASVFLLTLYLLHLSGTVLGLLGAAFAISMYGSPLAQLRMVLQLRDSSSMPAAQILLGFLCTTAWTAYGLCVGNPFIYVPNALGAILSAGQLVILNQYRKA